MASLTDQQMQSLTINPPRDPNTLSNYTAYRTQHTSITAKVDFEAQKLSGTVTHTLKCIADNYPAEILLDSSHVNISNVQVKLDHASQKSTFEVLKRVEPYGSPLKISLDDPTSLNQDLHVSIDFETTPLCTALQWLTPAQTSDKKSPYMFSQCQAIHARSIFPCQDTPDVKVPFTFAIESSLPVIASGIADSDHPSTPRSAVSTTTTYHFTQKVPIPSYLFALASGNISTAPIGKISKVATSPDQLDSAQWEFKTTTDAQIRAAESLVYPYAWGEYNVLVLPPSFPYGGMENPVFTFATPTVVSGDRENVDVIAHELSHSWSGNLVSNASWEHFWLNEGWTTYLERRILVETHGGDFAWRDFSAIIGWAALSDSIAHFGEKGEFTKLIVDLKGKDPDDAFSSVPYEKGFHFLWYLERLVGREKWDRFIPIYFEKWRGKSLDSYDFKATLLKHFEVDRKATEKLNKVDWDKWFYEPGFPPKPDFDTKFVDACFALATKWEGLTNGMDNGFVPKPSDVEGFSANQKVVFLERVLQFERPLPVESVRYMGSMYGLRESQNVELTSRYFQVAMIAGDTSIEESVTDLLGRVGRMKFVRPLYRYLIKLDVEKATECFERNLEFYHPICRSMVKKMLMGEKK